MFRNQYDSDITVWSPQGRIHQIEYAMEAVKQGSAVVGARSKTHAVLATLDRSQNELASSQKKLFEVDDHIGVAIAGLASDGKVLRHYMRTEALRSRSVFGRPISLYRTVSMIADKAQTNTQQYGNRPYGVGLLVVGYDESGPHLYESSPTGNFYDYFAMSIGARSQSARTYLEKHFPSFDNATSAELIKHALRALSGTKQSEGELGPENCSVGIVGKDENFRILSKEELATYFTGLFDTTGAASEAVPMETE